jgi:DNA-binding LacI/PurR family transcriptional regulator
MQRATILDVAEKAGVSKSTVSRVLRGEGLVSADAVQRVQRAVQELGYHANAIAGGLRTRRTFAIALVIPDISNPFFPEIIRGAQNTADARGYSVMLGNTDWLERRERDFLSLSRRNRVDGILINPVSISAHDLKQIGCPTVVLGDREVYRDFDIVGSDTRHGLTLAVEHLAQLGHTDIAVMCGPSGNPAALKRLSGCKEALASCSLSLHSEHVAFVDFSSDGGYEGTMRLLHTSPRPTAIMCGNDLIALGALHAIQDEGLSTPDDVAVTGIDNIDASAVTCPPLTTIAKPKTRIGEKAAALLIDRIEGKVVGPPRLVLLPTELIIRGSTDSSFVRRTPVAPTSPRSYASG